MEKKITINCANCTRPFEKSLKEHKRQIKKGNNRFFCNSSCAAQKINSEVTRKGNPEFLQTRKKDQYTPFRWFVLRAQYRDKYKKFGCNVTIEYLKILWENQNGICPLTGWNLILPEGTDIAWQNKSPANASLDRIDNSKGYIEGNVRFIAFMANIARQSFTDEQLIAFCKAVANKK